MTDLKNEMWGARSVPVQNPDRKMKGNASGMKYAQTYTQVTNRNLRSHLDLN